MKNWTKRTLAAVLTLLMVMQCAPLSAFADTAEAPAETVAQESAATEETVEETTVPEETEEETTVPEETEETVPETEATEAEEEAEEAISEQEEVQTGENVQPVLRDGTAVIPAGASVQEVTAILIDALVANKEEADTSNIAWEYECEGKSAIGTKNTGFGSIAGFTTTTGKYIKTTYTHPALAANADGSYQVRIAGTADAVTLKKVAKLSSSITLNDGVSVAIPHNADGSVDYAALRTRIFDAVVASVSPVLTVSDVEITYYAAATTGTVGSLGYAWVSLEGEKVYPAISAGSQKLKFSWAGNDTYYGFEKEVTVTLTERAEAKVVLQDVQTLNTRNMTVADVLAALVNAEETTVELTADNAAVEYQQKSLLGIVSWHKLETLEDGTYTLHVVFNGNADYLPATSEEVTVEFVSKSKASLELNEAPYSVKMPYTEDVQLDIPALKEAVFAAVVKSTDPELTAEDVVFRYYATATTGAVGSLGKDWVSLEGEGLTYPAISEGKQQLRVTWAGNEDFYGFEREVEVTLTEREQAPYTRNETVSPVTLVVDDDLNTDYDAIREAVFNAVIAQSDVLNAENVTIEYYYEGFISVDSKWLPLEGQEIALGQGYPAVSAGTKRVRISWPGSRDYAPTTVEATVEFADRPTVAFNLKEGPYEVGLAFSDAENYDYDATAERIFAAVVDSTENPEGLTFADVAVEYNVDKTGVSPIYKSLSESDLTGLVKFGAGDWKIRISWAGSREYKGGSVIVDVTMTDNRLESVVALKEGVSFTYSMDVNVMKQAIFDTVIDWDNSTLPEKASLSMDDFVIQYKASLMDIDTGVNLPSIPGVSDSSALTQWVPIEGKVYELAGTVLGRYPQMGAGEQQIRVKYVGNAEYRPSETAEGAVTVNKASVNVKVKTLSLYVDEALPADFVTTSPADKFDIYTISAGVTSNVTTAIYLNLPARYQSTTFLKVLDPIAQKLYGKTFTQMLNDGITLGELRQLLSTQELLDLLAKLNIDTGTFGQILTVINKLPAITDSIRVSFGYPNRAGMYLVTAVTDNKNYNTGVGAGVLVLKMRLSGSKLTWNETISGGKLTAEEAASFDFGATLSYNGDVTVDQSSVHYLYSGFTSKWKPYSSTTTPPTEPGRYVVTVCIIGGNHFAFPLTRSFQITK